MWSEVQKLAEVDESLGIRDIGIELFRGPGDGVPWSTKSKARLPRRKID
jgi:hypothetical protein